MNVQLINALTDAHLWADTYDRKLTDIFAVESDIAKTIADTLQAKLTGSEKRAIAARPTENQEAYQLYLKGRFFWNKRTATDLRKSIDYFQQAIAKDPNYALAYAGAAQAWLLLPGYGGGGPNDCFPQAEAAAKKALSLDDNSADAHAALAMVKQLYDFDLVGAIAEFERAIELDPNNATAHHWFANHSLAAAGQTEREIAEMKRALELDPLSLIINTNLGEAYIYAHRYDDAIAQLRKTVEMDAGFYFAHYMLGNALELKGQLPEAMAEYQKAMALNDDPFPKGLLGHLYGKIGRKDEALQILSQLRQAREQRYVEAYVLAIVYLGVGDHNEAVNWLEQGYRDRDGFNIAVIRVDPFLAPLHGDPRFEALAEKIVPAREFANKANAFEMKIDSFFAELKRRNVYKVAVAYAVVAWLLIQAASILLPTFEAPAWVMKVLVLVIIFGFPVALIFSWAFEITPEGIKLESEIEPNKSIARRTGRKIVAVTIALAVVAAGLFVYQLVRSKQKSTRRLDRARRLQCPEQVDRRAAVRQSQSRSGQCLLLRRRAG